MQIKFKLLVSACVLGIIPSCFAQSAGPLGGTPKQNFSQTGNGKNPMLILMRTIRVTPQEGKALRSYFQQARSDQKTFVQSHKGDQKAMQQFHQTQRQNLIAEFQKVLTADQFSKVQTFEQESKLPQLLKDNRAIRQIHLQKSTLRQVFKMKYKIRTSMAAFIAQHLGGDTAINQEFSRKWETYQTKLKGILSASQWKVYSSASNNSTN